MMRNNIGLQYNERDRLLDLWLTAEGEERAKILAKLVILDEEIEKEAEKSAQLNQA